MNHAVHVVGNSASVANRFGSESGIVRPEKLLDVLCYNNTGGALYMLVFEITNSLIPFGTAYSGSAYTLTGLTVGRTYFFNLGPNDVSFTNNGVTIGSATNSTGSFVAAATTAVFAGSGATVLVTALIYQTVNPSGGQQISSSVAPASGSTPKFNFAVQSGLGGTLGRNADMTGIYCAWSSTPLTLTAAGSSGPIEIVLKG